MTKSEHIMFFIQSKEGDFLDKQKRIGRFITLKNKHFGWTNEIFNAIYFASSDLALYYLLNMTYESDTNRKIDRKTWEKVCNSRVVSGNVKDFITIEPSKCEECGRNLFALCAVGEINKTNSHNYMICNTCDKKREFRRYLENSAQEIR